MTIEPILVVSIRTLLTVFVRIFSLNRLNYSLNFNRLN